MANIALLLIADAFGRRRGEPTGVALRNALPAMLMNNSGMGLAVAVALANRNAPAPTPVTLPPPPPASPPPGGGNRQVAQAQQIMAAVGIPAALSAPGTVARQGSGMPSGRPLFPRFLGHNAAQARVIAAATGIAIIEPPEAGLEHTHGEVVEQDPPAGARLRADMTTVRLRFR